MTRRPGDGAVAKLCLWLLAHSRGRRRIAARRGHRRGGRTDLHRPASTSPPRSTTAADVGGPALRELTFHQRAALLKALASHLREHRDELYDSRRAPARPSATPGSTSTAASACCSPTRAKAARELPNDTVLLDGERRAARQGRHLRRPAHAARRCGASPCRSTPSTFPVWGPLEKFAPAFLAGMPALVKPASQTAYLTARLVELIVESGCSPTGRCSSSAARSGDLLDHLTEQDLVAFTGSAATAPELRAHPAVVGPLGPLQRRGRLAELLDPRPRRPGRHAPSSTSSSSSSSRR